MTATRTYTPSSSSCRSSPALTGWGPPTKDQGALMTPEARMRAALEPKSSVPSRAVKAIPPPPGTGRPVPVNPMG